MTTNTDFIDYYEVLQISPRAELETIKRVFKLLAVRVHPDNPTTGDAEQFRKLKEAYETLSDPSRREVYDLALEEQSHGPLPVFEMSDISEWVEDRFRQEHLGGIGSHSRHAARYGTIYGIWSRRRSTWTRRSL